MQSGMMGAGRSTSLLLIAVSGTAAMAALFFPFTYGVSPAIAVFDEDIWKLGCPFFLSILVTVVSVRWMISGKLSQPVRAIAYVTSIIMAFVTFSLIIE